MKLESAVFCDIEVKHDVSESKLFFLDPSSKNGLEVCRDILSRLAREITDNGERKDGEDDIPF